jgi:hypothetical protein
MSLGFVVFCAKEGVRKAFEVDSTRGRIYPKGVLNM